MTNCQYSYRCKLQSPDCIDTQSFCKSYRKFHEQAEAKKKAEAESRDAINQGDVGIVRTVNKDGLWIDRRWSLV